MNTLRHKGTFVHQFAAERMLGGVNFALNPMAVQRRTFIAFLLTSLLAAGCSSKVKKYGTTPVEIAIRNLEVERQYRNADYAIARGALQQHVLWLDRVCAELDGTGADDCAIDTMIFYVRLARLEARNQGAEEAAFMNAASARCQQLKVPWADCSVKHLRREVDRIDSLPLK